ncbi:hypothetical protein HK104_002643, partial [Borealophlyctis nickersoniae]
MNTRFLSRFAEIQDSVLFQGDARLSGGIQPIGRRPVNIGIQSNPFNAAYTNSFINNYGPLQVNRVVPELPIKIDTTSGVAKLVDAIADVGQLMDFSDISLPDTPLHLKILQLKTSDDFTQTNGQLELKGKVPGCIPYYQSVGNGFAVNTNFQFDGATTLSVRFVKIENSFQLQDEYAAPIGYVNQAYQSSDNTGIDFSAPQNGRRIISIRADNETIRIDSATNKLVSALTYQEPLQITKGQIFQDILVKSGSMLKANYQAGRGIKITGNSISTDEEMDLNFKFPLIKTGTVVRLDMSGIDSICVNDLTDGQTEIRLKPGGLISSDMEGLFVLLQGENEILYENGIIRLLFDMSHFKLSAGDELQLNLSDIFTASSTEGLDIKVDNLTIKKDVSGLKGGYVGKTGSTISVIENEISENITASNRVTRVGNEIRGSYTGTGMIYVSGSSIGIRDADLDERIQQKTGISQPSSPDSPLSQLGKGLSN